MRHRARRVLGHLLLGSAAVAAPGCTSVRVEQGPVRSSLPDGKNGEIRLSLLDGRVVYMYDAQVVGDSIVGMDRPAGRANAERLAVRADEVNAVAVRRGDAFKTVLAVVGGAIAVLSFVVLLACVSLASNFG